MASVWQDLRLAFRMARRAPAATIGLVATMVVAVAGCATAFAVVNTVLLRPFPFDAPERLVHIQALDQKGANRLLSSLTWEDWKASLRGVDLAGYSYADFSITAGGPPETLVGALVSPEFFDVMRIAPVYGRPFVKNDFTDGERTVVLTHSFWTRRFGGDPAIVGKVIELSGPEYMQDMDGPYRVVGILPNRFWLFVKRLDVLVPLRFSEAQKADRADGLIQRVIGRVASGQSLSTAIPEIESRVKRLADRGLAERVTAAKVQDLRTWHVGEIRSRLLLLMIAAVTVLLLAALNIAMLLMAQMVDRRREFSVRLALGASRLRLIRQHVIESLAIGVTGGALGLLLGTWCIALVRSRMPTLIANRIPGDAAAITLDWVVVVMVLLAVIAVSILAGLAAAVLIGLAWAKVSLIEQTKGATAAPRKLRVRTAIVGLQVSVSATLVLTTVILADNQRRLMAVDLGFSSDRVLSFWLNPPPSRYPTAASRAQLFERVMTRTRSLPGVERVSGIDVPFHTDRPRLRVMTDGRTDESEELPTVLVRSATAEYFTTMGIRLLKGREFQETDVQGSQSVALVSQSAAALLWPGDDPLGRTIRPGGPNSKEPWATVVGIVADVRYRPYAPPLPIVYRPVSQKTPAFLYLTVRVNGDPAAQFAAIPQAVWSVDKDQPLEGPFLASTWVANLLAGLRFSVVAAWMFAGLAFVLAVAGLYGLTAYAVGQSTSEIGIRKALGASDRAVTTLFLRRLCVIIVPALCLGMVAAAGVLQMIRGEVDGLTFEGLWWIVPTCGLFCGLVCFVGAYAPLRRIRAVDPAFSIRVE